MKHCPLIRALLALTISAFVLTVPVCALAPDRSELYHGIDVSSWQGNIDFKKVRASGVEVVYIRASTGLEEDTRFRENARRAEESGLKFGFYHYLTARNIHQAAEQADYFAGLIKGKAYPCKPVMDFEQIEGLTKNQINEIALAFLSELEAALGQAPAVYSDAYQAKHLYTDKLSIYPLWVADYGTSLPETGSSWSAWSGYQYSDRGRISGIGTRVDLDYFTEEMFLSSQGHTAPSSPAYRTYKVKRGDTLWGIAQRYHTTVKSLTHLNGIENPNLIFPGEVLKIGLPPRSSGQSERCYTVKPGDTLWGISQKYGVPLSTMIRMNKIENPDLIYPGQVLFIPV